MFSRAIDRKISTELFSLSLSLLSLPEIPPSLSLPLHQYQKQYPNINPHTHEY
jgi:hypothetical protein